MSRLPQTSTFTASQIANALRRTRQSVHQLLEKIPAVGRIHQQGGVAKAWAVDELPEKLRADLAGGASAVGLGIAEFLESQGHDLWRHRLPLAEIAPRYLEAASKLQLAMRPMLALRDRLDGEEFAQRGVEEYQRTFGHPISTRHWRRLWDRTLERDRGAFNFDRLEIFLGDRVAARSAPPQTVNEHALCAVLGQFKDRLNPSREEVAALWLRAFDHFEAQVESGRSRRQAKSDLVEFLASNCTFLATSVNGARKQFDRKYSRWVAEGRAAFAVKDRRSENSGRHRGPQLSDQDRDKIVGHAVLSCGGRMAQAYRELLDRNELSDEIQSYYLSNPSRKSHIPKRILQAVTHEVRLLEDIHHGPRQAKLNGAHISRDWSAVASMDWFCADDVTLPVYYMAPDGKGGMVPIRGQLLVMIDTRSTRILAFVLIDEKGYTARSIRTLITRACDEHGLPRRGFLFEGGIWEKARILKGERNPDALSLPEMELGLRELGLEFRHSRMPRSKPVEKVMAALQNLTEGEPGYVGRDEQNEKFERIQRELLAIRAGRVDSSGILYNSEQWTARLTEICESYNAERQAGGMIGPHSPDEAFAMFQRQDDPPIRLTPECRYLLSHHKRPVRVTKNGIALPKSFGGGVYRNTGTGRLIGQTVLAWINPETPDLIVVTDTNRKKPICVERSNPVPAFDAPPELLAQEIARCSAHNSYARERYRVLKSKHQQTFRQNLVDRRTADLGLGIRKHTEAQQQREHEVRNRRSSIDARAKKLGLPRSLVSHGDASEDEGTALMLEAERENTRIEKAHR